MEPLTIILWKGQPRISYNWDTRLNQTQSFFFLLNLLGHTMKLPFYNGDLFEARWKVKTSILLHFLELERKCHIYLVEYKNVL